MIIILLKSANRFREPLEMLRDSVAYYMCIYAVLNVMSTINGLIMCLPKNK